MLRLLQSNAGMDREKTGTACDANETAIANFHGTFSSPCIDCVSIKDEPGTGWRYSSGGFVVAEAMFEEESGRASRNFLRKDILEPYGLDKSSFKNAGPGIANLATACDATIPSTGQCACVNEIAKVKFPGGLLANPLDYARLLMIIMHDGDEPAGDSVIPLYDIREVIHPGYHQESTLNSCSVLRDCSGGEQCIAERCMTPLGSGSNWYGFGVHMEPTPAADGYPKELYHTGGQDGFSSYFNIDRELRNGVLVFINGRGEQDRKAFRGEIIDAFKRHYRERHALARSGVQATLY